MPGGVRIGRGPVEGNGVGRNAEKLAERSPASHDKAAGDFGSVASGRLEPFDERAGGGTFGLYNEPEVIASVAQAGKVWDTEELIKEMVAKVTGKLVNVSPVQPAK